MGRNYETLTRSNGGGKNKSEFIYTVGLLKLDILWGSAVIVYLIIRRNWHLRRAARGGVAQNWPASSNAASTFGT